MDAPHWSLIIYIVIMVPAGVLHFSRTSLPFLGTPVHVPVDFWPCLPALAELAAIFGADTTPFTVTVDVCPAVSTWELLRNCSSENATEHNRR